MDLVKYFDPNRLRHFDMQNMRVQLDTTGSSRFHHMIPDGILEQGLRLISGDEDVVGFHL